MAYFVEFFSWFINFYIVSCGLDFISFEFNKFLNRFHNRLAAATQHEQRNDRFYIIHQSPILIRFRMDEVHKCDSSFELLFWFYFIFFHNFYLCSNEHFHVSALYNTDSIHQSSVDRFDMNILFIVIHNASKWYQYAYCALKNDMVFCFSHPKEQRIDCITVTGHQNSCQIY